MKWIVDDGWVHMLLGGLILAAGAVGVHFSHVIPAMRLKSVGAVTPGEIVRVFEKQKSGAGRMAGSMTYYYVEIVYEVHRRRFQKEYSIGRFFRRWLYKNPDARTVDVLYDPSDPDRSRPLRDLGHSWAGFFFSLVMALVMGGGLIAFGVLCMREAGRESRLPPGGP